MTWNAAYHNSSENTELNQDLSLALYTLEQYNTVGKMMALKMWLISSWLYCSLHNVLNTYKHFFAIVNLIFA